MWNKIYDIRVIRNNGIRFRTELYGPGFAEDVKFNEDFLIYAKSYYCISSCLYSYNCSNSLSITHTAIKEIDQTDLSDKVDDLGKKYLEGKQMYTNLGVSKDTLLYYNLNKYERYLMLLDTVKKNKIDGLSLIKNDGVYLELCDELGIRRYNRLFKYKFLRLVSFLKNIIKKLVK